MSNQAIRVFAVALLSMSVVSTGCRVGNRNLEDPVFRGGESIFVDNVDSLPDIAPNSVAEQLQGPHSVEEYIRVGLEQNSEIQEVRLLVESLENRVQQAASLPDPNLGATVFPSSVQTAAGEQDFSLSMNQKIPWRGKLATRAAIAQEEANAARSKLEAVKLKVVEQIKNSYFQLYFVQQAIAIIESDKKQLEVIGEVVDRMYRVKREVTQQDVLQVQVAISQIDTELVQYRQQKETAQAKLARLLHISPNTKLEAQTDLPSEQVFENIQQLYELAIQDRPELLGQLAVIQRDRQSTRLAELDNYPDMTLGFNWISTSTDGISPVANGDDAFMLTLGMNLPVYRGRIDAGIREAQTRTMSNTKKYDRIKDETMEGVADLFARIGSLKETLELFQKEIIPKQKLTYDQSVDDYQVGKVDFLQMIDNWRKLLRFHIQEKRLESDLHKALAAMTRQIGGNSLSEDPNQQALSNRNDQ